MNETIIYSKLNSFVKQVLDELKLKIQVTVVDRHFNTKDGRINARVGKVSNSNYQIELSENFFENISSALDFKYFSTVPEELAESTCSIFGSFIYDFFAGTTIFDVLKNTIESLITVNIVSHELGHVILGHLEKDEGIIYEIDNNESKGVGKSWQIKEMTADWIGCVLSIEYLLKTNFPFLNFSANDLNTECSIRQIFASFFIASFIQYDLFKNCRRESIEMCKIDEESHPHPYVRALVSAHALNETISNGLNSVNGWDDEISGLYINEAVGDVVQQFIRYSKDAFFISHEELLKNKAVNQWWFDLTDYIGENGYDFNPMIAFPKMCTMPEEDKKKILDRCD